MSVMIRYYIPDLCYDADAPTGWSSSGRLLGVKIGGLRHKEAEMLEQK